MAGDINVRFILKLCVIVIATSLKIKKVENGILAVSQMLVEPRWEINASQCFLDTNSTEGIHFQGSSMEICSLQVSVPRGTHIQLQIPGKNTSQESAFVYVERDGNLGNCLHKYVVLNEDIDTCSSIFIHENFQVIMQDNVTVHMSRVTTIEALPKCPEEEEDIQDGERGQISRCSNVKGYNVRIECDPQISHACRIKFSPNCGAILGYSEVRYQKCNQDIYESYEVLIAYSIQTASLDFSQNTLVEIDDRAFRSLETVQKLNLSKNNLTTLSADAFWGLINLLFLDIGSNNIAELHAKSFLRLPRLKYLSL